MPFIEIPARQLQAGDKLCIDFTPESAEFVSHDAWLNAWRIQSRAFIIAWRVMAYRHGFPYVVTLIPKLRDESVRIEHTTYGPFRARIQSASGAVIRVPRNLPVAVFRAP